MELHFPRSAQVSFTMFLLESTDGGRVEFNIFGDTFGQANELFEGVQTCEVVCANMPGTVMARGDDGTIQLGSSTAANLAEDGRRHGVISVGHCCFAGLVGVVVG